MLIADKWATQLQVSRQKKKHDILQSFMRKPKHLHRSRWSAVGEVWSEGDFSVHLLPTKLGLWSFHASETLSVHRSPKAENISFMPVFLVWVLARGRCSLRTPCLDLGLHLTCSFYDTCWMNAQLDIPQSLGWRMKGRWVKYYFLTFPRRFPLTNNAPGIILLSGYCLGNCPPSPITP